MQDNMTKDFTLETRAFNENDVKRALADLEEYVGAKWFIDQKATENQQWWRQRHWSVINESNAGVEAHTRVGSAWLINSLLNKHADIMDSFPKPNVLPRESNDEEEAKNLTDVIPTILEHNDYEGVYRRMAWDICIDGAAITGVFWDSTKHDGLGDIAINNIDIHNLFWKPGIQDIQESDKVYYVSLMDTDVVKARWPKIADKIGPNNSGKVTQYMHDDHYDTSQMVEVIDMYYKKTVLRPVNLAGTDEEGNETSIHLYDVPRTILHYACIIGDQLAFCSENEEGYENGFYEHGQYPFVIRRLFPVKDSPWGFGYLDIMKNPQKDIDKLDQAIIKNALMKAKPRYWVRKNANIDVDKFADWDNEIVEVASQDLGDAVAIMQVNDVPSGIMNHHVSKIEELKETSGNRDFSQGSTQAGVTAASAIAALQEAGSKLSRDVNKELYRGSREEYFLVIELIRQFYAEPRDFRVDDGVGGYRFLSFSNANIVEEDIPTEDGGIRHRRSIFDISVTAEKQSPFSRAAQNETAKELYSMGMFQPENAIPALACIDMMDFEGKDKVVAQIQDNSTMLQQMQAAMQLISQLALQDDRIAQMAMQSGLMAPEQLAEMQMASMPSQSDAPQGSPEERASRIATDGSYADKIRKRSANAASPN